MVEGAGFRVVETVPFALLFGLYDLPFVDALVHRWRAGKGGSRQSLRPQEARTLRVGTQPKAPSLPKRLLVGEDRRVPVLGLLVRLSAHMCANR